MQLLKPQNFSLLSFFLIYLVLWENRGMCFSPNFPYCTFLIIIALAFAIFLLVNTSKEIPSEKFLSYFALLQLILFIYGVIKVDRHVLIFVKHIRDEYLFNIFFTAMSISYFIYFFTKKSKIIWLSLALILSVLLSYIVIYNSTHPTIDTYLLTKEACENFFYGINPYKIYHLSPLNPNSEKIYEKYIYFNYWPLTIYWGAVFHKLTNDIRYGYVLCQTLVVGIFIFDYISSKSRFYLLLAFYWMSNLIVLQVNERAWIDALAPILLLGIVKCRMDKKYVFMSIFIGLLASIKLYFIFIIPFFLIIAWRELGIKSILISFISFFIPFIPYILTSPIELWSHTVTHFLNSKIRDDSLSIVSAIHRLNHIDTSKLGMILSLIILACSYLYSFKNKLSTDRLINLANINLIIYFLLSKQALCNYFYINMFLFLLTIYAQYQMKIVSKSYHSIG